MLVPRDGRHPLPATAQQGSGLALNCHLAGREAAAEAATVMILTKRWWRVWVPGLLHTRPTRVPRSQVSPRMQRSHYLRRGRHLTAKAGRGRGATAVQRLRTTSSRSIFSRFKLVMVRSTARLVCPLVAKTSLLSSLPDFLSRLALHLAVQAPASMRSALKAPPSRHSPPTTLLRSRTRVHQ